MQVLCRLYNITFSPGRVRRTHGEAPLDLARWDHANSEGLGAGRSRVLWSAAVGDTSVSAKLKRKTSPKKKKKKGILKFVQRHSSSG